MNEKYIQSLRTAIQSKHGCISRYVQTVATKSEINGQNGWQGNVEVFDPVAGTTGSTMLRLGIQGRGGPLAVRGNIENAAHRFTAESGGVVQYIAGIATAQR